MEPPKKFDIKKAVPISAGPPSKFDMANALPIDASDDIKNNPSGQGLYKMIKNGDTLHVPFGRVLDTGKLGWEIDPGDFTRFTKDYTHSQGIRADIDAALSPEDESTWKGRGLNIFKGAASGIVSPLTHPLQTGQSMVTPSLATNTSPMGEGYPATSSLGWGETGKKAEELNRQVQDQAQQEMIAQGAEMKKHPVYAASQMIAPALVTHGIAKVAPHVLPLDTIRNLSDKVRESAPIVGRKSLRNRFGGGEEFTQKKVDEFAAANEKARAAQQSADEVTEVKRGGADDVNAERQHGYEQRVEDHAEVVERQKAQHAEKAEKWNKDRADILKKHQDDTKTVQGENEKALADHIADVEKVARDNQTAKGIIDAREGLQKQIDDKFVELQKRVDAAQKQADTANDANWDAWRKKTANAPADIAPVVDEINAQSTKMNPQQVAEFRDILNEDSMSGGASSDPRDAIVAQNMPGKKYADLTPTQKTNFDQLFQQMGINPNQPAGTGGSFVPTSKLHGWKDMLEKRVRATKDGVVRHAIGQVLDKVRAQEDVVSQQAGAQPELQAARASHAPYVEAFRNSPSEPPTVASEYVRAAHPEGVKDTAFDERGQQLGNYDPDIPKLGQELQALRDKLGDLPSEKAARAMIKPAPEPPTPKPLPPDPEIPPEPKEPVYKKPPKEPSTKPYPEPKGRPSTPAAEDMTPERIATLRANLKRYGAVGQWATRMVLGAGGEFILSHVAGNPSVAAGKFGTGLLIGQGAMRLFSNILSHPSILEWMAKPTPADLEIINTLPPYDAARLRAVMKGLIQDEAAKNPAAFKTRKIAPGVALFLGVGSTGVPIKKKTLEELEKEADSSKEQPPAPGPQSSVTPAGVTHLYDDRTGRIISVQ